MNKTYAQPAKKKILLIDDEKNLLFGLKSVMIEADFDVLTADSGDEGEKLAKQHLPDVIVSDVMMPPPNGLELKIRLANDPRTVNIPFIFLTARMNQTGKLAGLNLGADDYITKPFNVDELIARIQAVLRRYEIGRQRGRQEISEINTELNQKYAEVQTQAITDPLTGLYNRRGFFEICKREIERSNRYKHPLTVIMFDLDHFKKINDTYGHAIGDQVLIEITRRCTTLLRKVDIFGRYGGDEFSIMLPETGLDNAHLLAERLLHAANQPIEIEQVTLTLTLSMGIADLKPATTDVEELLKLADHALYKAKESGRNCVFIYQE